MKEVMIYIAKNERPGADTVWQKETGKELLKAGLRIWLEDNKFVPNVKVDIKGKPYLVNSNLHFNISHSQRYVVCAIGENDLGIDIQFHKRDNVDAVAKKIMSAVEWQEYQRSMDKTDFFYDLWATKESYLKYTGEGLRGDMRLLDIDVCVQKISVDEDYSCMLCTQNECEYRIIMRG